MMGKQGRMGSFSNKTQGKAGNSNGAKKKMVIKPFKVKYISKDHECACQGNYY